MKKLLLIILLVLSSATAIRAFAPVVEASDLWFFQLSGPVKSIEIESVEHIHAEFDRTGRITYMRYGDYPVTIHRDADGRIDSITYIPVNEASDASNADAKAKRVDDFSTTKYRQRATDERGNWIARKTQRSPYIITTEYCSTTYYE